MNELKTLKEVCQLLNVSRRVIQGYEKYNLVQIPFKNKYGHNLYNEETIERMIKIRFYQIMGFKLKDIEIFIDEDNIKDILIDKLNALKEELNNKQKELLLIEDIINGKKDINEIIKK